MYYILQWTWGLLENLVGLCVYLYFYNQYHYRVGKTIATILPMNKGNFSLGMFIFLEQVSSERVIWHEVGHTYQNIIFGPAKLILVSIPSIIRYWLCGGRFMNWERYEKAWFEHQATLIGQKVKEREL